jgi:hypothetical protein
VARDGFTFNKEIIYVLVFIAIGSLVFKATDDTAFGGQYDIVLVFIIIVILHFHPVLNGTVRQGQHFCVADLVAGVLCVQGSDYGCGQ